jgi:uncharacterized protein (TIGR02145 family)
MNEESSKYCSNCGNRLEAVNLLANQYIKTYTILALLLSINCFWLDNIMINILEMLYNHDTSLILGSIFYKIGHVLVLIINAALIIILSHKSKNILLKISIITISVLPIIFYLAPELDIIGITRNNYFRVSQINIADNKFSKKNEGIIIGKHVWMKNNLDVSEFQNGDKISQANNESEWNVYLSRGEPAWCYYNFNSQYNDKYGKLYNGYVLDDKRNVAPEGWSIPTHDQIDSLAIELDNQFVKNKIEGTNNAGTIIKSAFMNIYAGTKSIYFEGIDENTIFWSKGDGTYLRVLSINSSGQIGSYRHDRNAGFSIRCIKDK